MNRYLADRLTPGQAAKALNVSYATVKQWIYRRKIRSVRTPGGHHRIPVSEVERLRGAPMRLRQPAFEPISVRNRLRGVVTRVRISGLFAEVTLDVSGQNLMAIVTRAAAEELQLRPGKTAVALIKAMGIILVGA
jgi:molybdopterin-binding protein